MSTMKVSAAQLSRVRAVFEPLATEEWVLMVCRECGLTPASLDAMLADRAARNQEYRRPAGLVTHSEGSFSVTYRRGDAPPVLGPDDYAFLLGLPVTPNPAQFGHPIKQALDLPRNPVGRLTRWIKGLLRVCSIHRRSKTARRRGGNA